MDTGQSAAALYLQKVRSILETIESTQGEKLRTAAERGAESIVGGGAVYAFGSGHSVLPVLDLFPRYGSFVGFYPLVDPRLMWHVPVGPGGARELLWLERQEGYIAQFLKSFRFTPKDTLLVFSHGGLNAAPVEVALAGRQAGAFVIGVTCRQNASLHPPAHSSGHRLTDVADLVIDNCVPPEDALIQVPGARDRLAAGSTIAAVAIAMALVAEIGTRLVQRGHALQTFVSPNVVGFEPGMNDRVFAAFEAWRTQLVRGSEAAAANKEGE